MGEPFTIVLAGDARQFDLWCREQGISRNHPRYLYASHPSVIAGVRPTEVVTVGTFWERRDAAELHDLAQHNLRRAQPLPPSEGGG